jgi:hypothetical protein
MHIRVNLIVRYFDSHNLALAMPLPFSASRELLARQRGPLEHRASGALTGPRAAHLLALTTASRPGIPATAEACLGTGTCRRRALSYQENEKGEPCRSKMCGCKIIQGIMNIGAKALQFFTYPHGVCHNSAQGNKRRKRQGTPAAGNHRRRRADAAAALRARRELGGT